MIAITRYRVPAAEAEDFAEQMSAVLESLAASPATGPAGWAAPSTNRNCGPW